MAVDPQENVRQKKSMDLPQHEKLTLAGEENVQS